MFSALGFLAVASGTAVDEVASSGLGLAFVTTQGLATQRYATTHNQVLLGLREALLAEPDVESIDVAGSTVGFSREPETLQLQVRIGNVEKTVSVETDTLVVTDDPAGLIGGRARTAIGFGSCRRTTRPGPAERATPPRRRSATAAGRALQ